MRALLQLGVILTTIHVFVSLEKLDCEENRARETSCGEPFLVSQVDNENTLAIANDSQLVKVSVKTDTGVFGVPSLGSFISPRHVITSSQVIHVSEKRNDEPRWALGNKTWDYKCDITTGENFAKVPSEYVKDIEIVYGNCGSNFTCIKKAKPTEAYLLNWCSDIDYYNREDAPLVLAFSKELKHDKFFCMPAAKKNLENFQVDVYRLSDTKETSVLKQRLTKINEQLPSGRWTKVTKSTGKNDRGSQMIGEMHNKTIFMGVGAFTGYYNNDDFNYFYNIQGFRKEVYELTGIINENDFVSTTVSTTASTNVTTSTVPATTTSECNQVTGFDQIERVTREPLDDEEKIKPIPNDVKTDRNAWPVMMINVEDSSDTVYEEEVKELFVSSSFFNGDGDEKKHFNILIGVIFYWIFVN